MKVEQGKFVKPVGCDTSIRLGFKLLYIKYYEGVVFEVLQHMSDHSAVNDIQVDRR